MRIICRRLIAVFVLSFAVIGLSGPTKAEVRSINRPFAKLIWRTGEMAGQFSSDEIAVHALNLREFGARFRTTPDTVVAGCADPEAFPSDADAVTGENLADGCVIVRSSGMRDEKLETCLRHLPETATQDICQFSFTDTLGDRNLLWMKVQNFTYISPVKSSDRAAGDYFDFQCSPEWGALVVRQEGGLSFGYSVDEWLNDDGVPSSPIFLTVGSQSKAVYFAASPAFQGDGRAGAVFLEGDFLSETGEEVDLSGLGTASDFLSEVRFFSAYDGGDAVSRSMVHSFSARSNGYDKIEAAFSVQVNNFRIDWDEPSSVESSLRVICTPVFD